MPEKTVLYLVTSVYHGDRDGSYASAKVHGLYPTPGQAEARAAQLADEIGVGVCELVVGEDIDFDLEAEQPPY